MIKNISLCNNCGKQGHLFHQCKLPVTSYGIILFKRTLQGLQFLMIRRKDSFGYIDFIRGKYSPYNINQIQNIINEMSSNEKAKILADVFDDQWKDMWGDNSKTQYRSEEFAASKKSDLLKNGVVFSGEKITLRNFVDKSNTSWSETEWEFPKGRRDLKEKDLDCATREFEEETGIPRSKITIVENLVPFEETFIGTNHKSYKHKYFLAQMNEGECVLNNFQKTEVSKLEWKTIDECLASIRPYNIEKKKIITNVNKVLQEFKLYL